MDAPQSTNDSTDANVLPEAAPRDTVSLGMYGLGAYSQFNEEAFGRSIPFEYPLGLRGYVSVLVEPHEVASYAPHLEGQVPAPFPALRHTGNPDDVTYVDVIALTRDEINAWRQFNLDSSFDTDEGYAGGMYHYEQITVTDGKVAEQVVLETVPNDIGQIVTDTERDQLVGPELMMELAGYVRAHLEGIGASQDTPQTTSEGPLFPSKER